MIIQSFGITRVPSLGILLGSPGEKWHLDVVPCGEAQIYYREGSGTSSQRLWVVWSLCLRLSLLSPLHHFHSTCTNCLLFLVVQVNIVLNSRLWVLPSPISEFQHTLLPPKCCELKNIPQLYPFSTVSLWDPLLGPLRSLGACHTDFASKKIHQDFGLYFFSNLQCLSFGAKWKASCLMVVFKVEYVCCYEGSL
jgi:hypothetical protein